jgi:dolichyl-phosphate-mannose-protein mannosyltransferase
MTSDAYTLAPPPDAVERAGGAITRAGLRVGDILTPLAITGIAGFLRFWRLGTPHSIVPLDETYYAPNSLGYLCHGTDMSFVANAPHNCSGLEPVFAVHPPVGKILIAAGIKIFGYRPFGWRFFPALAGTLIVLLVYLIGRRLWPGRRWPAAAASILVASDGLLFVQSRLAMLDIFLTFFIVLGVWLMLEDRARAPGWKGPRWWRLGAGVAFGLAIASKWAAIPMLPVVGAVALAWDAVRMSDERDAEAARQLAEGFDGGPIAHDTRPFRRTIWFQMLAIPATFLLIPVVVYVASYTPWFLSSKKYVPPRCYVTTTVNGVARSVPKTGLAYWLCYQREISDYHQHLQALDAKGNPIHPYMSRPWSWPWISRPASHYNVRYCSPSHTPEPCKPGETVYDAEILGLPNPVIWWMGFFIALPVCIFWMIFKRDDVAALLVVLFAPLVLPWFIYSRPLFLFYMTPAVILLALMVTHLMVLWKWRRLAVAFVALAVLSFAYFYPVLAAYPLPLHGVFGWESRMWFGHGLRGDCLSAKIKLFCWI